MTGWFRFIWGVSWRLATFAAVIAVPLWLGNRDTGWDANAALAAPGEKANGKVGVIVTGLVQPSTHRNSFWINANANILEGAIPWPLNRIAGMDRGVALFDPGNPGATQPFRPARLLDMDGRDRDIDGTPWLERYRRGELIWQPPSASMPEDIGWFLYPARRQGLPTAAAKVTGKARYLYYGRLPGGYLPHGDQSLAMIEGALAAVRREHPNVIAAAFADSFDPEAKKQAVMRALDAGADTLVLGAVQANYSDFEDMKGGFRDVRAVVEQWRAKNDGKPIRILLAPWLSTRPAYDALWLDHFAASVPRATEPGQKAMGIVTLHGLPVSLVDKDGWSQRWPLTFARLKPRMEAILRAKGYAAADVQAGFEAFADSVEDPGNKLVSVNELYREAARRGYAVAVGLPVEFFAENTDTLYGHAVQMFAGLPGYRAYDPPPPGTDWSKPYVCRYVLNGTTIIYAGTPGGDALPRTSRALADALGSVIG